MLRIDDALRLSQPGILTGARALGMEMHTRFEQRSFQQRYLNPAGFCSN